MDLFSPQLMSAFHNQHVKVVRGFDGFAAELHPVGRVRIFERHEVDVTNGVYRLLDPSRPDPYSTPLPNTTAAITTTTNTNQGNMAMAKGNVKEEPATLNAGAGGQGSESGVNGGAVASGSGSSGWDDEELVDFDPNRVPPGQEGREKGNDTGGGHCDGLGV